MVVNRPWKQLHLSLLSLVLLMSYQQPMAAQHFRSANESTMPVTAQMANLAITAIHDEASTTRNKWLTLEAWKTILYHYYDLDDELGFSMNILTRAVNLFGSTVTSKVSGGNSTGVHLRIHSFVKHDKHGKISGTDHVRFLLLADSKKKEPKEPTDVAGWIREQESRALLSTKPLLLSQASEQSSRHSKTAPTHLVLSTKPISRFQSCGRRSRREPSDQVKTLSTPALLLALLLRLRLQTICQVETTPTTLLPLLLLRLRPQTIHQVKATQTTCLLLLLLQLRLSTWKTHQLAGERMTKLLIVAWRGSVDCWFAALHLDPLIVVIVVSFFLLKSCGFD